MATARQHLDGLYDHYLLTEPARGRYRLHDLLREHARALAAGRRRRGQRRRPRPAAELLPAHRRGRRPAHRNPPPRGRPATARHPPRHRPTAGHNPAGLGLAGRRAGQSGRGGQHRSGDRASRACHRNPRRDQRLPLRPGSLGSVHSPAPGRRCRRTPRRG
jgi:hypothetical protein